MKGAALKVMLIAIATLFVQAAAAALFIESGIYNIGADDHHTKVVLALITQLRDRSIDARLESLDPQQNATPAMIKSGAEHYAVLCAGCHLAPGVAKSDLRAGLYPHPPNLAQSRRNIHVGHSHTRDHNIECLIGKRQFLTLCAEKSKLRIRRPPSRQGLLIDINAHHLDRCTLAQFAVA